MNKEKYIHHQRQNWLSGATGFNVATAPALNNRLELLADSVESTKSAETSTDLFSEWGVAAKKLRPDDEPLRRYTLTMPMVADT